MRRELEQDEQGVLDEIGVLALHTGYADRFFPGTSVLHTHPRYMFFTCWNYLDLARRGVSRREFRQEKLKAERRVTNRLRPKNGEPPPKGIIGGQLEGDPAQPPDFIYWTALRVFGFYEGLDRSTLSRRWNPEFVRRREPEKERKESEDRVPPELLAQFHVPPIPEDWRDVDSQLTFALTPTEAEFLRGRLEAIEHDCLLKDVARRVASVRPEGGELWEDPLIGAAAQLRNQEPMVERARQASGLAHLLRAIYAALVEKTHNATASSQVEGCRETLEQLFTSTGEEVEQARALDLEGLRQDLPSLFTDPRRADFIALLSHVQARLKRMKGPTEVEGALLDEETYERFRKVERARKGWRARLPRDAHGLARRQGFQASTVGVRGLSYRWVQVRTLLMELHEGLNSR
jgi:hypothetical protein